jgi:glycosyltransferase involved in cell wall biosynthesis
LVLAKSKKNAPHSGGAEGTEPERLHAEERPIRVLLAHSFYRAFGGEDHYVIQQLDLLRRYHDVELFGPHNQDLADGLGTVARMTWSPRLTRDVLRTMRRIQPDVVHVHNIYPALGPALHLAARRGHVPLVMTVHNSRLRCPNGLTFTQGSPCHRCETGFYIHALRNACFPTHRQAQAYAVNLWIHRFIMQLEGQVSLFIAPSQFIHDRLLDWGMDEDRVTTVRNFTATRSDASPSVGTYGLYVGRLSEEKGLHDLLLALQVAGDPPFRVVGAGPLADRLQVLAVQLGLRRIQFLGWLDRLQVDQVMRKARFLVMPSRCDENAPMAALEAMAEGRPLLVSRSGGLPELVASSAGLIFERSNVESLAAQIRLFEDDELCLQAGTAALQFAHKELTPEIHRRRLEKAYSAVSGHA